MNLVRQLNLTFLCHFLELVCVVEVVIVTALVNLVLKLIEYACVMGGMLLGFALPAK